MIRSKLVAIAVVAVSLFAGFGIHALAIEHPAFDRAIAPVTTPRSDAALNDRVETLLRTDIGLAGSRFRIHTRDGVVTLAGDVPDKHSLLRAMDLASSVKGVREVRNALEIDFPK